MRKLFPKKYRTKIIALLYTILIHALLILILFLNFPSGGSISTSDDMNADELFFPLDAEISEENIAPENISDPNGAEKGKNKATIENNKKEAVKTGEQKPANFTQRPQDEKEPPEELKSVPEPVKIKQAITENSEEASPVDTISITKRISETIASNLKKEHNKSRSEDSLARESARKRREQLEFYSKNRRSIYNFKKVYPYALKTRMVVDSINKILATMTDEKAKNELIKKTEKELFDRFQKDVFSMSTTQGKVLIKLISRETGKTSYELIKEYKGGIPANFWYGIGRLFGENLKDHYDKAGQDSILEVIVQKYLSNELDPGSNGKPKNTIQQKPANNTKNKP